jgi:hypothetical protein
MRDDTFHSLGLLAWYNDEELNDDKIDFVKIGNAFIENDNKEGSV